MYRRLKELLLGTEIHLAIRGFMLNQTLTTHRARNVAIVDGSYDVFQDFLTRFHRLGS